ncbi:NAD(P)/FAD-dependent oxidoreductase [Nakamurella sp. GG22]
MSTWDVVVIGAGLVGSAAARYLATAGATVAVIGPAEPENADEAEVFASHYDQGRVQRLIGFDQLWTRLSVESARAWPDLERFTGLTVHDPVGCLYLAPHRDDYLKNAPELGHVFGLQHQMVDGPDAVRRFAPQLQVPDGVVGMYEPGPAGSINPRAVVAAQLLAAEQARGTVLRDVVSAGRRVAGVSELTTTSGEVHRSGTVVVATGSFTNASRLLNRRLDVLIKGETVLMAEVSAETAASMAAMPSVLYEVETDDFDGIYLIKPLRYPDGRWYLKLGMNQAVDPLLDDIGSIRRWFRNTTPDDTLPRLRTQVLALFPHTRFLSFRTKRCILSRTVGRRPYLGPLGDGVVVAMGCNGYSAMASDAQGRIAATLALTGEVPDGYDAAELAVRTVDS